MSVSVSVSAEVSVCFSVSAEVSVSVGANSQLTRNSYLAPCTRPLRFVLTPLPPPTHLLHGTACHAALNEDKAQAKAKVEEIKYSGTGSLGSRRIVDEVRPQTLPL